MQDGDESRIWRATLWALLARTSPLLLGPITVLLVASTLDPVGQGVYYAATALIRWQTLLEMGLGTTLQQRISWHHAQTDAQAPARLSGVLRVGLRCYAVMSIVWLLVAPWGGGLWLESQVEGAWQPWLLTAILVGLTFPLQAGLTFLEGIGRVEQISRYQAIRAGLIRAGLWAALLGGLEAFSIIAEPLIMLVVGLVWLCGPNGAPIRDSWRHPPAPIRWRSEIWPLQSTIGFSAFSGYLPYALVVPATYALLGPVLSGQLGMTMTLIGALYSGAFSFAAPRVPHLAISAARGETLRVRREMRRVIRLAGGVYLLGAFAAMLGLLGAIALEVSLTERLTGPVVFGIWLAAMGCRTFGELLRLHTRTWQSDALWPAAIIDLFSFCLLLPAAGHSLEALAAAFLVENVLFATATGLLWRRWMQRQ